MQVDYDKHRFDSLMLPHMEAAYNLARWLMGNGDDAADVVQESYLKALRFFGTYRGGSARSWLMAIIRNTSLTMLAQKRNQKTVPLPETENEEGEIELEIAIKDNTPEFELLQKQAGMVLDQLIQSLPVVYREIIILREIEDLSYKEIAEVISLPIGTVMSRLARARKTLQKSWQENEDKRGPA